MTFTSNADARNEVVGQVYTAWIAGVSTATLPLYYWDVRHEPPESGAGWARVTMRHTAGGNAAIGNKLFTKRGLLTIQIFSPFGQGLTLNDDAVKVVLDALEGQSTASGAWFRNVRENEIGEDGHWFNTNVIAEFEYDLRKS